MKRTALAVVAAAVLSACSGAPGRVFARYYDPRGLFSANLPAANDITVTPPQPSPKGPSLLTGVLSAPPQPSPSPQSQFGGGLIGQQAPSDQTVYQALVVTTDTFQDLSAMVLYFLTANPGVDVQLERPVQLAGTGGELVVADLVQNGQTSASVAAAFSLGEQGTGYILAAVFPPGEWNSQEPDFTRILRSFDPGVPPGLRTFPLSGESA